MSAVGTCPSTDDRLDLARSLRARCEANGSSRDCRILNLNPQRVFVESFVPTVTGSNVTLRFKLPNGHEVCTRGVVSSHKFEIGFGVEFVSLSALDRDQIGAFVA
jgi:hypothetical protein